MLSQIQKKRRIHLVVASGLLLVIAALLMGYGFRDGIAYFRLPSDVVNETPPPEELFRLGGLVVEGSVIEDQDKTIFEITDSDHAVVVVFRGILPDLFAEGQGVIALGRLADGVFSATEVLAKHDETYMPKEVAKALNEKGLFRAPVQ